MASSLIRINEATTDELRQLKGIGPKRADYILSYRHDVTPICNTFDLAAATGLSLKACLALSDQIDWTASRDTEARSLLPVIITSAITIWLIFTGFEQITSEPWQPPGSYFNFALALILMGGLAATGDIAIASVGRRPTETTWVFAIAVLAIGVGLSLLVLLLISGFFLNYPGTFIETLKATLNFIGFTALVLYLVYSPGLFLRLTTSEKKTHRLRLAINIYDYSFTFVALLCGLVLVTHNTPLLLEEVFAIWCITILFINGTDLTRNQSAFVSILSLLDQGRLRFNNRRTGLLDDLHERTRAGWLAIGSSLLLTLLLIYLVL